MIRDKQLLIVPSGPLTQLPFQMLVTAPHSDDGDYKNTKWLSASEVAAIKLDADWVILSACNTAAGDAQGVEALSGLARAFIYAGV